jgi:hypothetical protein
MGQRSIPRDRPPAAPSDPILHLETSPYSEQLYAALAHIMPDSIGKEFLRLVILLLRK